MPADDCLFCKIIAGDIPSTTVLETETVLAFRDISPQADVHVRVVPRTHYEDAETLAVPGAVRDRVTG